MIFDTSMPALKNRTIKIRSQTMNVYLYKASLYCAPCGQAIKNALDDSGQAPADPSNEYTFDSDDYPKGPYPDGGGESDSPQHCDACGVFLNNPLTQDGELYVIEAVSERPRAAWSAALVDWFEAYHYLFTP
jgi:hypothetical protein